MRCSSCEIQPINPEYGVCSDCAAMYTEALGTNWKDTEVGQFLLSANEQTTKMNERIRHEPTGYALETMAAPTEEFAMSAPKNATVDEMITALVVKHKWGYRRIHSFLQVGGYDPPSLATVKRRVARMGESLRSNAGCAP